MRECRKCSTETTVHSGRGIRNITPKRIDGWVGKHWDGEVTLICKSSYTSANKQVCGLNIVHYNAYMNMSYHWDSNFLLNTNQKEIKVVLSPLCLLIALIFAFLCMPHIKHCSPADRGLQYSNIKTHFLEEIMQFGSDGLPLTCSKSLPIANSILLLVFLCIYICFLVACYRLF